MAPERESTDDELEMTAPKRLVLTAGVAHRFLGEFEALAGVEVVERYDLIHAPDPAVLQAGLDGAWAVVAGTEPYTRPTLEAVRVNGLRAILRWGTGSDAIDIPAATDVGVAVVTAPGANAEAVADMALALMLATLRQIPMLEQVVRSGSWRGGRRARAAISPARRLESSVLGRSAARSHVACGDSDAAYSLSNPTPTTRSAVSTASR
jgi:D-3-phosphoglycerate dehydrogenase